MSAKPYSPTTAAVTKPKESPKDTAKVDSTAAGFSDAFLVTPVRLSFCNIFFVSQSLIRCLLLSENTQILASDIACFGSFFLLYFGVDVLGSIKDFFFLTLQSFAAHAYACYCICKWCTPVHLQHHTYIRNLSGKQTRGNKWRGHAYSLLVCLSFIAQHLFDKWQSSNWWRISSAGLTVLCFIRFFGCIIDLNHELQICNFTGHVLGL